MPYFHLPHFNVWKIGVLFSSGTFIPLILSNDRKGKDNYSCVEDFLSERHEKWYEIHLRGVRQIYVTSFLWDKSLRMRKFVSDI